jgi:drug/metabolite transporter (DMT)-like permease
MWIKIALREINPFSLVFFRVLFASLGLGVYFVINRKKLSLRYWWIYTFIGFFNVAMPFVLISWAEMHISSGLASILNSTVPLFTIAIASIFYKEDKFTLRHALALMVGFIGVLILSYKKMGGSSDFQFLAILAMLAAVIGYSASTVFARRVKNLVSPEEHSLGQMLAAFIFVTPGMFVTNPLVTYPHIPATWLALLWLGLIVSFIAALVWFQMIYEIGPSRASMMIYMFPLVGVLLGVFFLGEKADWQVITGGLLILASIYIVNSKSSFPARKAKQSQLDIP